PWPFGPLQRKRGAARNRGKRCDCLPSSPSATSRVHGVVFSFLHQGGNADLASFTVNGAFDSDPMLGAHNWYVTRCIMELTKPQTALGRFSCCLDEGSGEPKAEHATRTLTSEVEGSQN
ncbi:unnamed protein product, partial [Durusdinium trenchii]